MCRHFELVSNNDCSRAEISGERSRTFRRSIYKTAFLREPDRNIYFFSYFQIVLFKKSTKV